jgi:hypothetical protein
MVNCILFEVITYPVRYVAIEGSKSELMISTEDLETVLIIKDGGHTSPERLLKGSVQKV